ELEFAQLHRHAGRMTALALLGDDACGGHVLAVSTAVSAVLGEAAAGTMGALHLFSSRLCLRNTMQCGCSNPWPVSSPPGNGYPPRGPNRVGMPWRTARSMSDTRREGASQTQEKGAF